MRFKPFYHLSAVNGIWIRANPNIRILDDESADFSQIFEDLAKYLGKYLGSSNPNRASGGSNIRFAVNCLSVRAHSTLPVLREE